MNTRPRFLTARFLAPMVILALLLGQGFAIARSASVGTIGDQDDDAQAGVIEGLVKGQLTKQVDDSELSTAEIAAGTEIVATLGIADWLGPLAPMALSPFFGVTCMSGMALFGGDWMPMQSGLLSPQSPLANHAVFWTFLVLTALTSLPRLTKVSKPFAQAIDHVEAYAGIATILIVKLVLSVSAPEAEPDAVAIHQAGVLSLTTDMLLMVAMAINMIVIHAVRFFFEFLIWATPIPAIDACFEAINKAICAGLMALYAYSPMAATAVNLLMLAASLVVFNWVHRRVVFCRTMALDPLMSAIFRDRATPTEPQLVVFPTAAFGPFPTRAKLILEPQETGWRLTMPRWFRPNPAMEIPFEGCDPLMHSGIVANTLDFNAEGTKPLSFSKRYSDLPAVARQLRCNAKEAERTGVGSPGFA